MAKDDLISKNNLLLSLAEYVNSNAYLNQTALDALLMVMRWAKEDPAVDAVPVVRCRQCAQAKRFHNPTMGDLILCNEYRVFTDDDGFCHKGAKMDGGAKDENT